MKRKILIALLSIAAIVAIAVFYACATQDEHIHTYFRTETVKPTCTQEGYTEYVCSCGDRYTDEIVKAYGHEIATVKGVDPDCKTDGLTDLQHCIICGEVLNSQEVIPATGHKEVIDPAVPATCTETGKTEGKHCSVCGEVLVKQETVPAKGHTEVVDEAVAATCTETGKTEGKHCSFCGVVLVEQQTIPATGHSWSDWTENRTSCDKAGERVRKCTVCGQEEKEILAAGQHSWNDGEVTKLATCTTQGQIKYTCTICGATKIETVPALGHDIVHYDGQAATCTEKGWEAYDTCSRCDYTTYKEIAAIGHTEVVDEAVAATCTETGKTEGKHCSVCNEVLVKQETVLAKGHTEVVDEAVAATCTETGKTEGKHCSVCNEVLVEQQTIPAKGHSWGDWMENRTSCDKEGERVRKCTVCGQEDKETLAAGQHSWNDGEITTPATCTTQGQIKYTCTVCGATNTETIPALGHDLIHHDGKAETCTEKGWQAYDTCSRCDYTTYVEINALGHDLVHHYGKAATCTENGWQEYDACTRCDYTTYKEISANGHIFGEWEEHRKSCLEEGERIRICTVCGTEDRQIIPAGQHKWNDGEITKNPTCTAAGEMLYTCTLCGQTKSEIIAATGHSVVTDEYVAPTCTDSGLTEGSHCSVCGEIILAQQIIAAQGHTPAAAVRENEITPTCTSEGGYDEAVSCAICGVQLSKKHSITDKIDHIQSEWITDELPTCEGEGSMHKECTVCHTIIATQKTEALGHDMIKQAGKAATCTEQGYDEYYVCSRCGYATMETIDALGHSYVDGVCERCGSVKESAGLNFTLSEDGSYYIVTGLGQCTDREIVIPESYGGKPVREIADAAFMDEQITGFVIPDTVILIGYEAFAGTVYYNDLDNWQDGVLYIGNYLIDSKKSISGEITVRQGTTLIAHYAFGGCQDITSVIIPDTVKYICGEAFFSCAKLERVVLGRGVVSIGDGAFSSCKVLKDVYYSGSAAEWSKIDIGANNTGLTNAAQYYYSQTQPSNSGKYWHYVNGAITIW